MMAAEISREAGKRDPYRLTLTLGKTPAERMADMARRPTDDSNSTDVNPATIYV